MRDSAYNDSRILREWSSAWRDAMDRTQAGAPTHMAARQLVRVYNAGAMPTQPDHFFLCHPCEADGAEQEGIEPTFNCDPATSLAVDFLGHAPQLNDLAVATAVGGRWVAEIGGSCKTTICVGACGSVPVYGAKITLVDGSGNVVASCTTPTSGCCQFNLSGTYTVQLTTGGNLAYSARRTLVCDGTITIALGNNAGLVCCGGYAIPQNLTLTDAGGSLSFVYYPNSFFPTWFGGHSVQRASCPVTTPNNVCVVGPASNGPVKICYQMVCFAGQDPTFSIQRSWSWVYQQGTLTPIWYQDASGITPGLPCATSPPAICGSPLTDTAGFTANPSSTSPFILSGTPVAASANSTVDPVGGSIVISA
jgi:hypothetical protein